MDRLRDNVHSENTVIVRKISYLKGECSQSEESSAGEKTPLLRVISW